MWVAVKTLTLFLLTFGICVCVATRTGPFKEDAFVTWSERPKCAIVSAGPDRLPVSRTCVLHECNTDRKSACNKRYATARDGQAYVSYVVQNYDKLPDFVMFVHGHARAWHQHERIDVDVSEFKGYKGLNRHPIHMDNLSASANGYIWRSVFSNYTVPEEVCSDGSMQFMASRDRLRTFPLRDWLELYSFLYGTKTSETIKAWDADDPLEAGKNFLGTSYFVEWIIHILVGEPNCKH